MMFTPIDIATIDCGNLRDAVNAAIQTVAVDVHSRPDILTERVISLRIKITPDIRETTSGPRNRPKLLYVVQHSIPPVQGVSTTQVVINRDGSIELTANEHLPDSDDDVEQEDLL